MSDNEKRLPMAPRPGDNTVGVRQGVTVRGMRYVLGVSMLLVVLALAGAWMFVRG